MQRRPRASAVPPGAPPEPGTYVLALSLERQRHLIIGRLGRCEFERGTCLYVGSARGPGGLAARLAHHWRRSVRPRWHIDYLRRAGRPLGAGLTIGTVALECQWAARLAAASGIRPGPAGFGASDCRCATHLFVLDAPPVEGVASLADLAARLDPVLSCGAWLDGRGRQWRTQS